MEKNYYVYEIINLMGTVEYVGKTCNLKRRMTSHTSRGGKFHNRKDIIMVPVSDFITEREALDYEIELQRYWGLDTAGDAVGKAHKGKAKNEETRAKMSASASRDKKIISEETRAKISKANKGKIKSEETRAKIGAAHKGKSRSEEARSNISKGNKGRIISEETRAKISKANKGRIVSEETRAKMSAAQKEMPEETRAKISASASKRPKLTCPHCGKIGGNASMLRWHFDNCKYKK